MGNEGCPFETRDTPFTFSYAYFHMHIFICTSICGNGISIPASVKSSSSTFVMSDFVWMAETAEKREVRAQVAALPSSMTTRTGDGSL